MQDRSLRMQKQDGQDQLNGKGKSSSQETIVSDEAALDQRHYEKVASKLVGNILHLHGRIWLKINLRKAGYVLYLTSEKLNCDFNGCTISSKCPVPFRRSYESHSKKSLLWIFVLPAWLFCNLQNHRMADKVLLPPL